MIKYTTPTITLRIKGQDITSNQAYVTLEQANTKLTKPYTDLNITIVTVGQRTDTKIEFILTQEESSAFDDNSSIKVQVNWISQTGIRGATRSKKISAIENLLDEVIEYVD